MARSKSRPGKSANTDALAFLQDSHRRLRQLFGRHAEAGDEDRRRHLLEKACLALKIHSQLEQELLYPALRAEGLDDRVLDEAGARHERLQEEVDRLETGDLSPGELQAAEEEMTGEALEHLDLEEEALWPLMKAAGLDLRDLGAELRELQDQLQEDLRVLLPPSDDSGEPESRFAP
ncbi:hemerythrin domain-containing protein [Solimonas sp. SE-A11]|uniref:hemerythrin domain-containing protein n=1 Tax=Solimonas sp. SE-A11 TaxID=3054954 RepID=UPI00259CF1E1|nr:hemerythrin domain-containing protein [Solimonas sp. SE-A11]MDM4769229.1 hemerythrin domain-containing protein [Solimonas sp. SE-A11]